MKNRTVTRTNARTYSFLSMRTLVLAGLAVMIALGISSLALYTRTTATQGLDRKMPNLNGDAAVDYLRSDSTYATLERAMADAVGDDLTENPEAVVKITANDARPNDYFGSSVAISGDTVIVGAPQTGQVVGGALRGAAYIFIRNGAAWTFQRKFISDAPAGDPDLFGATVAISGDTVVVGAPFQGDPNVDETGAAYVYFRTGTTWTLQKKLSPTDTPLAEGEGQFGKSVAISGDTVLVGTEGQLEFTKHSSFVHVFVREGTTWTPQALLTLRLPVRRCKTS